MMTQDDLRSSARRILHTLVAALAFATSPASSADEVTWTRMENASSASLHHVSAYSGSQVVATGAGNTVLLWDGEAWASFAGASGAYASVSEDWRSDRGGVAMAGPNRVFIAHYGGDSSATRRLFQWNGSSWDNTIRPTGGNVRLTGVWAQRDGTRVVVSSLSGVYASGTGGGGSSGTGWVQATNHEGGALGGNLIGLKGNDAGFLGVIGGADSAIYLSTNGGQSFGAPLTVSGGGTLNSLAPLNTNALWVVGNNGKIHFWDGSAFAEQASPTSEHLFDVFALSEENVWAVGANNTLLHFNGTQWQEQSLSLDGTYQLRGIDGDGLGNLYIVGSGGLILHAVAPIPEPALVGWLGAAGLLLTAGCRNRFLKKGGK